MIGYSLIGMIIGAILLGALVSGAAAIITKQITGRFNLRLSICFGIAVAAIRVFTLMSH